MFDWVDENDSSKTPEYYIYKMIETLLPKAMSKITPEEIAKKDFSKLRTFKLVELWAKNRQPRKGWVKVC